MSSSLSAPGCGCYILGSLPLLIVLKHEKYEDGLYNCYATFTNRSLRVAYEVYLVVAFMAVLLLFKWRFRGCLHVY